jgi:hypothetical protein
MLSRPFPARTWEVDPVTGFTYSTLPAGQWVRTAFVSPSPGLAVSFRRPKLMREPRTNIGTTTAIAR